MEIMNREDVKRGTEKKKQETRNERITNEETKDHRPKTKDKNKKRIST